ncbi:MAG TPA: hypothetical protein VJ831_00680, partial [Jatrophihabitantaceae bacterium]|nr:hypothetical protein [Jatrophihabitantaceae bacterium]
MVDRPGLFGARLRDELTGAYDEWLSGVVPLPDGVALAAVGGLEVLFRTTRLGLQMRAVADDDELLGLAGQAPA